MRLAIVSRYLGLVLTILGLFMLIPLIWSLLRGESCASAFGVSIGITVGIGLLLWQLIKTGQGKLSRREAIVLVAGSWIFVSVFGSLPYIISGTFPNLMDSWFESVSGFTTTGATVMTSIEDKMQGILLWRSLTQWIGGMGIITLFVALFPLLGIGATHLVESEMPGPQAEKLTPRIRDTAKAVWILYLGFSVFEFLLLLAAKMPVFDALTVTLSTMPTGGFAPVNMSIESYNSLFVEIVIIVFMAIAGVNFGLFYFLVWKRQVKQLIRNAEFRLYIILILAATVLILINLTTSMDTSFGEAIRHSSFQVISIMTTTGFNTVDFNLWPAFAKSILLTLMIIGASAGSTGGALKVVRLLVLVKYAYRRIILAFNPRVVVPLKIGGTVLPESIISGIIGMAIVYAATIFIGFLIMSAVGLDHVTALSSVIASVGNIGPGLNLVGPVSNYEFIPPIGKLVLTVCMIVGRLELFTVFMIFIPPFWKWR
ncbi:MAG: TrkH family potassium uptake protein [Dehalococcoidales bacterium]|nr:MAG: TrkH family potassium uptake protein [Dehalococcoidales bacterium]